MLVEHDVEAELVAKLPLVVIAVKQIGRDARVAFAVGEGDAQRAGMLVPRWKIGLLAEVIDSHWARSRHSPVSHMTLRRPARLKWSVSPRGGAWRFGARSMEKASRGAA